MKKVPKTPTKMLRVLRDGIVLGHVMLCTDGQWTPVSYGSSVEWTLYTAGGRPGWPSATLAALPLVLESGRVTDPDTLRFVEVWRSPREEVLSVAS
jgi:hypothetical protein